MYQPGRDDLGTIHMMPVEENVAVLHHQEKRCVKKNEEKKETKAADVRSQAEDVPQGGGCESQPTFLHPDTKEIGARGRV